MGSIAHTLNTHIEFNFSLWRITTCTQISTELKSLSRYLLCDCDRHVTAPQTPRRRHIMRHSQRPLRSLSGSAGRGVTYDSRRGRRRPNIVNGSRTGPQGGGGGTDDPLGCCECNMTSCFEVCCWWGEVRALYVKVGASQLGHKRS